MRIAKPTLGVFLVAVAMSAANAIGEVVSSSEDSPQFFSSVFLEGSIGFLTDEFDGVPPFFDEKLFEVTADQFLAPQDSRVDFKPFKLGIEGRLETGIDIGFRAGNSSIGYSMSLEAAADTVVGGIVSWGVEDELRLISNEQIVTEAQIKGVGRGKLLATWSIDGRGSFFDGDGRPYLLQDFTATAGANVVIEELFGVEFLNASLRVDVEVTEGASTLGLEGFTEAYVSRSGLLELNWENTARIESLAFEDGTTPEELGWTVEFASGQNPNAVPEPSSLALLGIGSVGLIAVRRRRR